MTNSSPNSNNDGAMGANMPEYSVSEISQALKRTVEQTFSHVRVRGEISGLTRAGSGHMYLSLKDENAVLDGVCWRGTVARLAIDPEDGMEVIVTGRLSTYPGRSRYQIVIEAMEMAGEGALLKLLEDRRKKLLAEGLFDAERKKPRPFLPEVIGVVTSPTGAVIRDILHRLSDRFPRHVLLWPVMVQGEGAAEQVAAAIEGFNRLTGKDGVPRPNLLIVARGGGSLEDLWAFNEEIVVRAAAASDIPLISAVGHETDTTLIDFASDLRAPTPTAAAELAVPVRADLLAQIADDGARLVRAASRRLDHQRTRLEGLARGITDPRRLVEEATQRLDDRIERLVRSRRSVIDQRADRVATLGRVVASRHPDSLIQNSERELNSWLRAWQRALKSVSTEREATFKQASRMLESLSYQRVLERGFALVTGTDGNLITAAAATEPGMPVSIRFRDGDVGATIDGNGGSSVKKKPRPKKQKSQTGNDDQGSLL